MAARRMFIHFEPTFGGLRGNVRTSSMARWTVRGRLHIRDNQNFFRYLLRLRRYKQIFVEVGAFQRGVGHFESKF